MSNSCSFLLAWCCLLLSAARVSAVRRLKFDVFGKTSAYDVVASMSSSWDSSTYKAAVWRGMRVAADNFPCDKNRPISVNIKFKSLASYGVISRSKHKWVEITSRDRQKVLIQAPSFKSISGLPPKYAANYSDTFDIEIHLDNATKWYTGKSRDFPLDQYDLATVVLNELYRSFIFSGFLKLNDGGTKAYLKNDQLSRYDALLVHPNGCPLLETQQEYWMEAVTNRNRVSLRISNSTFPSVYTPETYVQGTSIYSLDCPTDFQHWQVGCQNLPQGIRRLSINDKLKAVQAGYLDMSNYSPMGVQDCLDRNKLFDRPPLLKEVPKKSKKLIGGMPIWVFGLCLVILCIVLAILIFALCTIGAVQKSKERQSCWNRFTWCCTAVNSEPEAVGVSTGEHLPQGRAGGSSSALFTYIDTSTAQRYSLEGNPLGGANRASLSGLRNSFDVVRYALGIPNAPTNTGGGADDNVSHGIATAETVLPGRLDNA